MDKNDFLTHVLNALPAKTTYVVVCHDSTITMIPGQHDRTGLSYIVKDFFERLVPDDVQVYYMDIFDIEIGGNAFMRIIK